VLCNLFEILEILVKLLLFTALIIHLEVVISMTFFFLPAMLFKLSDFQQQAVDSIVIAMYQVE